MEIVPTALPDVLLIKPKVWSDERGFFLESWNEHAFERAGLQVHFRQDNHSRSVRNVVRGLHYQLDRPQGKLVRCTRGVVFDVAVDLRRSSPTFRRWIGIVLSERNQQMLWIPPGFAHGFLVTSDEADVHYKASELYDARSDRAVLWNDPQLAIDWPLSGAPLLSKKDGDAPSLANAEVLS
ncbi:MAG: dTDP-4-dehydrorhamnose 3,5-epimerase [Burkholderiaceae bacterium]